MKYTYVAVGVLCLSIFFIVPPAYGAELSFSPVSEYEEDVPVTIIEVRLKSEGSELNAIEGVLAFEGAGAPEVTSIVIETGDSAVSFWPVAPHYDAKTQVVRFTGGSISSFPEGAVLFRMRISSKKSEPLLVSMIHGNAYRNDGAGTREPLSARSLSVLLMPSKPNIMNATSPDLQPPYFDALYVSQVDDLYEGRYFISFNALDTQSGISHYEVVEGQIKTRVEGNGIYVLADQERDSRVVVIAYDKAGNSTSVKVPTRYAWISTVGIFVGISIIMLLVVFRLLQKRKKRV